MSEIENKVNKIEPPYSGICEGIFNFVESDVSVFDCLDMVFDFDISEFNEANKLITADMLDYKEHIYALSNPLIPNLLKIGKTTRSVDQRVKELSASTGVPTPFVIESVFITDDCAFAEKCIHEALSDLRVSKDREFFNCSVKEFEMAANLYAIKKGEDLSPMIHHKRFFTGISLPKCDSETINISSKTLSQLKEISKGDINVIATGLIELAINAYGESALFTVDEKHNKALLFPSHASNEQWALNQNLKGDENG